MCLDLLCSNNYNNNYNNYNNKNTITNPTHVHRMPVVPIRLQNTSYIVAIVFGKSRFLRYLISPFLDLLG